MFSCKFSYSFLTPRQGTPEGPKSKFSIIITLFLISQSDAEKKRVLPLRGDSDDLGKLRRIHPRQRGSPLGPRLLQDDAASRHRPLIILLSSLHDVLPRLGANLERLPMLRNSFRDDD